MATVFVRVSVVKLEHYKRCEKFYNTLEKIKLADPYTEFDPSAWYKLGVLEAAYKDYIELRTALRKVL